MRIMPTLEKELLDKGKKRLSALVQIQAPLEFFKTVFDEQDDLMDLGEDYEPIRDFFGSEQLTIFTRALDMLNIYEDSKTYIVDAELEDVVDKCAPSSGCRSHTRRFRSCRSCARSL